MGPVFSFHLGPFGAATALRSPRLPGLSHTPSHAAFPEHGLDLGELGQTRSTGQETLATIMALVQIAASSGCRTQSGRGKQTRQRLVYQVEFPRLSI